MSIPFWYLFLFAMSMNRLSKLDLECLMFPCKHCILLRLHLEAQFLGESSETLSDSLTLGELVMV